MAALINRRDRLEEAASTAFFWLAGSGAGLALLSFVASPAIGIFFRNRSAGHVAAALSGWLLLRALTIVPDSLLQRRLSFARRAAVDPLGALVFAAVSVGACAMGAGIWGLVAALYASEVVEVAAAWWFARFRPRWRLTSLPMLRELAAFARPVLASEIVRRVAGQMDIIMLGRFASTATLGQYRNGYRLASQPIGALINVGSYVLLPSLARLAGEGLDVKEAVRRAYRVVLAVAVPVSFALVPLGVPLAVVVFGDRWRPAGHAIAALWGLLFGGAVSTVAAETAKATGHPRLLVRIHTLNLVVTAALVTAAAVPFGLIGVATAVSVSQVVVGIYAFGQIAPFADLRWSDLVSDLAIPSAAAGCMIAAMLAFASGLHPLGDGEATAAALTIAEAAVGAVTYLALLFALNTGWSLLSRRG